MNVVPYVTFDNPYSVQYTNLYILTGEIISNVNKYIGSIVLKRD